MSSSFCGAEYSYGQCGGDAGFWGGANGWFGGDFAEYNLLFGGVPASVAQHLAQYQLQREVDDFFNRLPPEAYFIGDKSWAYWVYKGDTLRAEIISFSMSRGVDAYFFNTAAFGAGFAIGSVFTDVQGQANTFDPESGQRAYSGAGMGGSWDDEDIRLYRFGWPVESLQKLADDAARAEKSSIGLHGVSVMSKAKHPAPSALMSEVQRFFPVQKTGENPFHYTVILPKPLTQADADRFNLLFRGKK